ncbi:MAG: ATP-binding protein [Candidatus Omnitrophica bacterium]|nr:ATP-binding protein [Candidatus Omnitrophota bacterium]MCM8828462.1 ATP-binding protein [Candidatus Omnitrophota bacterium]
MKLVMLVVEEKSIADTLCFLLKDDFVSMVVSPSSVRDEILKHRPDIIVMDFLFKEISTYQIVETISKTISDVPVIALVDSFGPSSRRLMDSGVYEIIEKPFDPEKFKYALKRAGSFVEAKRKERIESSGSKEEKVRLHTIENTFFQKLSELIVGHFKDPDSLISSIINLVRVHLSLSGISFFVRKGDEFVFHSGSGVEKRFFNRIRFNQDSAIYRWLISERKVLQKNIQNDPEVSSEMNFLKANLLLPLLNRDGNVYGFFSCGSRITGEDFDADTIRFFVAIVTYLSVLIEDAFLFQDSVVQKEFQKIILENVPTGIIVLDDRCNVMVFNRHAESILGKKAIDVINSSVEKCGVEFASRIRVAVAEKRKINREELFMKTSKKWLGMSCDFIRQNNDTVWATVIFQDITFAKELENEKKRIEQNQYWQHIARQLSHEIKNPLVAIKTFACLLPERFSDESFRTQFYSIVNDEIRRLTVLVEKIARLADREPLALNRVNFFEVLKKIQEKFPSAEIVSKDGVDISAEADRYKIQEAIEFLLDFCVQDIKSGGKIKISLEADTGVIEIKIEESGSCISIESPEDMFQPFSNHLNAITSLNLAICRKIVEQHSGSIRVEFLSAGEKRFILTLPAAKQ